MNIAHPRQGRMGARRLTSDDAGLQPRFGSLRKGDRQVPLFHAGSGLFLTAAGTTRGTRRATIYVQYSFRLKDYDLAVILLCVTPCLIEHQQRGPSNNPTYLSFESNSTRIGQRCSNIIGAMEFCEGPRARK